MGPTIHPTETRYTQGSKANLQLALEPCLKNPAPVWVIPRVGPTIEDSIQKKPSKPIEILLIIQKFMRC